jgi:putative acetyltransferase
MAITVTAEPWDSADGAALRAMQRRELDERYGSDDHEPGAAPNEEDITVFLVGRTPDGQAVACGALRRLDRRSAEIKRMFVLPASRGSGVATAVLRARVYAGEPLSVCYARSL